MTRRMVAVLLTLLALPLASARAQDPAFTVTGVEVDKTAADAPAAREAAISDGQRIAFRKLMERLTPSTDQARWARVTDREVAPLVESYQVEQERSSNVRYLATLTYRFRAAAVRSLLNSAGVAFAQPGARPVLVIPLYRATGGETLLWEDANPWRQLWNARSGRPGLITLLVPTGDAQDMGAVDTAKAAAATPGRFEPLLQRYGASDAVVAEIANEAGAVTLTVRREAETLAQQRFPIAEGEDRMAVLGRAADRVTAILEERWKRDSLNAAGASGIIQVRVPIKGLEDWNQIRRRLSAVPLVRSAEVKGVSRTEGQLALTTGGDIGQLKTALAQRDLLLEEQDGGWILRSRTP